MSDTPGYQSVGELVEVFSNAKVTVTTREKDKMVSQFEEDFECDDTAVVKGCFCEYADVEWFGRWVEEM